ncbi:MAG: hypothetical protein IJ817_02965 [Clostridia bacterium]|nr:hypothetical protein [Clostridia bacterium]
MKKWFSRIVFICLALVVSVTGFVSYYTYHNDSISASQVIKHVDVGGNDVKVEVYTRGNGDKYNAPVFAISDLLNKAINYKKMDEHKDEEVNIDAAIYRVETDTACYYKPGTRNYGKTTRLTGKNYTDDCERVAYTFVKAALYGINVRLIYHRDKNLYGRDTYEWFQTFMDEKCIFDKTKTVADFLEVRKCEWSLEHLGANQMHNKQVMVNKYIDHDGVVQRNAVFSMTSNVDRYDGNTELPIAIKDWVNTGYIISNHDEIYERNERYFEITFENYQNRYEFVDDVLQAHENNLLNYKDDAFEVYFSPLPQNYSTAYDVENNPYAYYVEKLVESTGQIKCYINDYHVSNDAFTQLFFERLNLAFTQNTTQGNDFGYIQGLGFESLSDPALEPIKEIASVLKIQKMTHCKDMMFYFADEDLYVTITGSANKKLGEFLAKSNEIIVFKETGEHHEIYDTFLKAFNEVETDVAIQT